MELQFTPEQEAQLSQIATKNGTDPTCLVKSAVLRLIECEAPGDASSLEIPVVHLGAMTSLHRRDLYNDAR